MEIAFCIEATDPVRQPSARELVRRLQERFLTIRVDWQRGDQVVQAGLDRLIALGTPEVIVQSHRAYFNNVVFVSISEPHWGGVVVTSYLHSIWSPLDDGVVFELHNCDDPERIRALVRELGEALGMVPYSESNQTS